VGVYRDVTSIVNGVTSARPSGYTALSSTAANLPKLAVEKMKERAIAASNAGSRRVKALLRSISGRFY
jgi:hypothetical protein